MSKDNLKEENPKEDNALESVQRLIKTFLKNSKTGLDNIEPKKLLDDLVGKNLWLKACLCTVQDGNKEWLRSSLSSDSPIKKAIDIAAENYRRVSVVASIAINCALLASELKILTSSSNSKSPILERIRPFAENLLDLSIQWQKDLYEFGLSNTVVNINQHTLLDKMLGHFRIIDLNKLL